MPPALKAPTPQAKTQVVPIALQEKHARSLTQMIPSLVSLVNIPWGGRLNVLCVHLERNAPMLQ